MYCTSFCVKTVQFKGSVGSYSCIYIVVHILHFIIATMQVGTSHKLLYLRWLILSSVPGGGMVNKLIGAVLDSYVSSGTKRYGNVLWINLPNSVLQFSI